MMQSLRPFATRFAQRVLRTCVGLLALACLSGLGTAAEPPTDYAAQVRADHPAVYWRFEVDDGQPAIAEGEVDSAVQLSGIARGHVELGQPGPTSDEFPAFARGNRGAQFFGDGGSIRVADPGDGSPLAFQQGDAITIEAWVQPVRLANGQQMYVVGKGRTGNPGFRGDNQNYALRLAGQNGEACISFLFRNAQNRPGRRDDFHRWTSNTGFALDSGWHHVAVTYTFGQPQSLAGYIDGAAVKGTWDYGGSTDQPPVVDNDELWIGSSMGGQASSTFNGMIDEIALHRRVLPADRIRERFQRLVRPSYVTPDSWPTDAVLVEVFHNVPDRASWDFPVPQPAESYTQADWAIVELPQRYNEHGVREDRSNSLLVRMSGWVTFPEGEHRILLRSRSASRLFIDGQELSRIRFAPDRSDGHNALYLVKSDVSDRIRPPQPGDAEIVATFRATGQPQRVVVEAYAGGKKRRPELGELCLSLESDAGMFNILSSADAIPLTDEGWLAFVESERVRLSAWNQERRRDASRAYDTAWDQRHAAARALLATLPAVALPAVPEGWPVLSDVDRFISARLAAENVPPQPLVDDWAFLRRASLDVIGRIPTPAEIETYFAAPPASRRRELIARLLNDPGWADHWVGYWQDVLAENPNIVNPTLNNTGPFRWWLYEAFQDNLPFDRFATELVLMDGSERYGGAGGFAVATQNDVPMAAKANILAQAFLGVDLKCARCHDAPYHPYKQADLFQLAAMLKRAPEKVPASSTVPIVPGAARQPRVTVTLKPGEALKPVWPFAGKFGDVVATSPAAPPDDTRARMAALMTAPSNERFAEVLVNRLWQRYVGRGLVEPVDDWNEAEPSHPELLAWLARELIDSGYNLKHVASLILNSHLYQRMPDPEAVSDSRRAALFAGPVPRRMTAEQLVDSLFTACGKDFHTEELSIDVDGGRSEEQSISLGVPRRAWQFTSLSNERDRPSLSLPAAQTIVDVLEAFGWRAARPDPLSERPSESTVLQPAILANGVMARRVYQMSDDSRWTELATQDLTPDQFIDAVCQALLTRPATPAEQQTFRDVLESGYDQRIVAGAPVHRSLPPRATGVSWSNHLHPVASELKLALQKQVEQGDPPTERLQPDWRERAEDCVWALMNAPEFLFVP